MITHCDKIKPDQPWITSKLAALTRYTGVTIPEENVVLFDKTRESLENFAQHFQNGDMTVKNVSDAIETFDREVEDNAKNVDRNEENSHLYSELKMLAMLIEYKKMKE